MDESEKNDALVKWIVFGAICFGFCVVSVKDTVVTVKNKKQALRKKLCQLRKKMSKKGA